MSKFDTHGGYFAPAGYMRINEGGSHEENPNGGVQVGVDPDGNPNLLEEGEPVYKDFVFSDNIKADESMLEQFGIPKAYAGKLYSEIADSYIDEAELRPNDEISTNGLNAMLGRLAQAQEAQKAAEEEAALAEELANMSPEELAALEQMLAQEQGQTMPAGDVIAPEQIAPEQVVIPGEQMQPEVMPMMACGGKINKFAMGGDEDDPPYQAPLLFNPETGNAYIQTHAYAPSDEIPAATVTAYGPNPVRDAIYAGQQNFLRGAGEIGMDIASLIPETAPIFAARDVYNAYRDFNEGDVVGGIGNTALSMAGVIPLFPRFAGGLHRVGRGALRNATSHAKKVRDVANKSAQAVDATRAGRNASRSAVNDAYDKYIALLDKMDEITDVEQMTTAREEAEALLKEIRANRKDLHGDWFKLQGEKIANRWNKVRRGVANVNESAWRGISGNKTSGVPVQEVANTTATTTPASTPSQTPVQRKSWFGRNWGWIVPTAIGVGDAISEATGIGPVTATINAIGNRTRDDEGVELYDTSNLSFGYANGGKVNRFDWGSFLDRLNAYRVSRNPGGTSGTYKIDSSFPLGDFKTIKELEDSQGYRAFTDYVMNNADDENVLNYLRALDAGTSSGVAKLFDTKGNLNKNWQDLYKKRRYDQKGGIYHFYDNDFVPVRGADPQDIISDAQLDAIINRRDVGPLLIDMPTPTIAGLGISTPAPKLSPKTVFAPGTQAVKERDDNLTTLPRYAGAIGSTLLAVGNLLQQPDHYEDTPIRPVLPYGDIRLQDERYMPIDMEMIRNQMQAQNTANARAILNSGAGPSAGALINAADYNGGMAMGNALANVWQANNQERNRVINTNNQNEATRAQFYRNLDSERTNILNNFALQNRQNALRIALLNNQAEQDQYNAFGQNLGNALQALSGIGRENFATNQARNNRALLFAPGWDGRSWYKRPIDEGYGCGGTLLKTHKKNKK